MILSRRQCWMRHAGLIAVAVAAWALCGAAPVFGCSAFLLQGETYRVIGFNENWRYIPGMVVVNKRGLTKQGLSWDRLVGQTDPSPPFEWVSQFGSVTFNGLGIDLPFYGMNEAGLFVVELSLEGTRSLPDSRRPHLFWAQWIQYQLDRHASVDEVIQHLRTAPVIDWWPRFPGSHFFVADRDGHTAAIEFIEGELHVATGETMPVPVLCTGRYAADLAAIRQHQAFGGVQPYDHTVDAQRRECRFAKLAHRWKESPSAKQSPVDYAWHMLGEVRTGTWQLVADVRSRTLYFRTQACNRTKSIALDRCDFTPGSPIRYLDVHQNFSGDVTDRLGNWTVDLNAAYVAAGFPVAYVEEPFFETAQYRRLQTTLQDHAIALQRQLTPAAKAEPAKG